MSESQRTRLEHAVVELAAANGYASATVQQIVAVAAVSRQTFYELYTSKADCYASALEAFTGGVLESLGAVAEPGPDDLARLQRMLLVLFGHFADQPSAAVCLLFETAGSAADHTGRGTPLRPPFAAVLEDVFAGRDGFAVTAFAAMIRQLTEEHVAAGRFDTLPQLAAQVVGLLRTHVGAAGAGPQPGG